MGMTDISWPLDSACKGMLWITTWILLRCLLCNDCGSLAYHGFTHLSIACPGVPPPPLPAVYHRGFYHSDVHGGGKFDRGGGGGWCWGRGTLINACEPWVCLGPVRWIRVRLIDRRIHPGCGFGIDLTPTPGKIDSIARGTHGHAIDRSITLPGAGAAQNSIW